ncbi:MAG: tRNA (adenosine(37)-N6)-dimethylallyltransferase MiaA, partial [Candidatus Dormibacteria bacterium]
MGPSLIGVVGPTAAGKTALSLAVARRLGRAELLNADSRQLIRGLTVATCSPSAEELGGVPCHLLGICEPGADLSVAGWVNRARDIVDDAGRRGVRLIMVGGTGLFVDALVDGFEVAAPPPDPASRADRDHRAGLPGGVAALAAELAERDPQAAA